MFFGSICVRFLNEYIKPSLSYLMAYSRFVSPVICIVYLDEQYDELCSHLKTSHQYLTLNRMGSSSPSPRPESLWFFGTPTECEMSGSQGHLIPESSCCDKKKKACFLDPVIV